MVDKLKSNLKDYFSNDAKIMFLVVLILLVFTTGIAEVRKVVVISIDGKETKVTTLRHNFKKLLMDYNITIGNKDKVSPPLDSSIKKYDRITVKRAVDIQVAVDGKCLNITTAENKVEDMLCSEGICLSQFDDVFPGKQCDVKKDMKIVVNRIRPAVIIENKNIDYSTIIKDSDDMEKGTTKVVQEGETGQKTITTKVVFQNGKEIARNIVSEVILKQPVDKVMAAGILGAITPSRGGDKLLYTRSMMVRATAYTADYASTGKNPGDDGYGYTATGTKVVRNSNGYSSIAVDPRVIPFGTKLYVEDYGLAVAVDTGGAIKGSRIDVYYDSNSEALNWGVKMVNIYFLK